MLSDRRFHRRAPIGILQASKAIPDRVRGWTATLRADSRPNYLFLLADDHAGYVLGCDGNPRAESPNLDLLASESVRFARHYCNSPICTPSRQSLLTGQLPHANGVTLPSTPLG
jgi:arylsulfatase A-like enzyme